jgi:hypothetical protein
MPYGCGVQVRPSAGRWLLKIPFGLRLVKLFGWSCIGRLFTHPTTPAQVKGDAHFIPYHSEDEDRFPCTLRPFNKLVQLTDGSTVLEPARHRLSQRQPCLHRGWQQSIVSRGQPSHCLRPGEQQIAHPSIRTSHEHLPHSITPQRTATVDHRRTRTCNPEPLPEKSRSIPFLTARSCFDPRILPKRYTFRRWSGAKD